MLEWGPDRDFRISLVAFQDPDQPDKYCASLQGTPEFFGEFPAVLEQGGQQAVRSTLQVCAFRQPTRHGLDGVEDLYRSQLHGNIVSHSLLHRFA
jgi:hypothetical protein